MRTWIWIMLLALLGSVGGAALFARPWVEKLAHEKAEARGLELKVKRLSLGFMSADFKDVELRLQGVEGIVAHLPRVEVDASFSAPFIKRIQVTGGRIEIDGTVEELQARLETWRASRVSRPKSSSKSSPRRVEVARNLSLVWSNAANDEKQQVIEGLNIERGPTGQRIGVNLIRLTLGALRAEIGGAILESRGTEAVLESFETVTAAEVRIAYDSPEETEEAQANNVDPSDGSTRKRESEHLNQDSGLSERLKIDPTRVSKLKGLLAIVNDKLLDRLPPLAKVDKLWVTYLRGDQRLHVGPSQLTAKKNAETFTLSVTPKGKTKGTPVSATFRLPRSPKEYAARVEFKGGPVALSSLGIKEGVFGLTGVDRTFVSGTIAGSLSADSTSVEGGGDATIEGLGITNPRLAERLVTFPRLFFKGAGNMSVDGSSYSLSEAEVSLGEARFVGAFQIERSEDHVALKASTKAPLVSCQALLDSAPRGLLGAVEQVKFDGTFSIEAGVEADTRRLSDMQVRWNFKNGCRASAVPPTLSPEQFRGLFRREVIGAGNYPMQLEFGPLSNGWTPYDEVSPHIEAAILVSEDGRFFRHNGFDDRAIESAIRANTRAGSFVRGASTVSMQLAKNLYLSREKTLARKLREAALTSLLEQSFEKRELLELYVNIVEFGPSIYGIRAAAEHYFNTHPGRLTPAQAFFLISILPAPSREYFKDDGLLKESRQKYVHHLMRIATKRGRLGTAELEKAELEVLKFGESGTSRPEEELPGEISVPDPRALTGSPENDLTPPKPTKPTPPTPPKIKNPSTPKTRPLEGPTQ